MINHWVGYEDFEPTKEQIGFIYEITNTITKERYIGSKRFWSIRTINGKKVREQSDWRRYKSSSDIVKKWRRGDCEYRILTICHSLYELTYREIEYLIARKALLRDDYMNYMMGSIKIGRCPESLRL